METIKSKKTKFITIGLFVALIVSLLLSHTIFADFFSGFQDNVSICIMDTVKKNTDSLGTDARLKSVKINKEVIPFEQLQFDKDEWVYSDGLLIAINPQTPVSINYTASKVKNIEIEFQTHEGSGVVSIIIDGEQVKYLDLYSQDWGEVTFRKSFKVSVSSNWIFFLCVFIGVLLSVLSIYPLLEMDKKQWCFLLKKLIIPCTILLVGGAGFGKITTSIIMLFLFLILSLIMSAISLKLKEKKNSININIYNIFVFTITSVLMYCIVEKTNNNIWNPELQYILGNITIYIVILLIFFLFSRRQDIAVIMSSVVVYCYAITNYYVTFFRGSPIVPGDFFVIGTARNVLLNYQYKITWNVFLSAIAIIIWSTIVVYISRFLELKKAKVKHMSIYAVPIILLIYCISCTDFYEPALDFWNLKANVRKYGIAMAMVSNVRQMRIQEPESYSQMEIEDLYKNYVSPGEEKTNSNPNVIAIMNESFSDLSVISDMLDSNLYMPFFNSLEKNTVKGSVAVSVIGGGTSNTEYEFLTGNSMAFMLGTVPYQQFVIKDSYSTVGIFKEMGYHATAIHPYYKSGYNRERVYPYLGFDEFYSFDDFINPKLSRDIYITDEESYSKVIQVFEENQKINQPVFVFNVTMQNHGEYSTGYYNEDRIKIPGKEGQFPDVEEYLTLIKESDDAFRGLIDYFSTVQSPTVVIMFGDHQPYAGDDFYSEMLGKPLDELPLEERQVCFEVPFIIWANYDIEEQDNIMTSANYLASILFQVSGLERVPYQNYLLQLKDEIAAMNTFGYFGSDGIWHSYTEENKYSSLLDVYRNIQYNNMFAKKKCNEWFTYHSAESGR